MELEPKRSREYDGKIRWLWPKVCDQCGKIYYVPKCHLHKRSACSVACHTKKLQTRKEVKCALCGKSAYRVPSKLRNSKSGLYFCSHKCKSEAQCIGGIKEIQPKHYGKATYTRAYLVRTRGHKCQMCLKSKWQRKPIPLEVDHIDGNSDNNDTSNLRLLCPNCHALTPTYCGRNKGNGRILKKRQRLENHQFNSRC